MSKLENKAELRLANGLLLPREAVTWVLAYLAKRGAGKTYNAAVQAEEMVKAGIPIIVIDGMGIWWGLRSGVDADGKPCGEGLPVVVFGGEHADLPLIPEKAAEMARAIVESNISCVLDLSGFSKTLMRKVVQAFLDELYQINRVERHVFIEESDMFAPQKPFGNEAVMCLSAVDNFIRRGGNKNLGCTLITQRTAVLNKDILTQADCLVILRTLAPQDKAAIQEWVKEQTEDDKDKLKVWYDSLKSLKNGEAYVWHPEEPTIENVKVQFRQRETFHATREFLLHSKPSDVKLMDIGEFVNKFKAVFAVNLEQAKLPVNASASNSQIAEMQQALEKKHSEIKRLTEVNADYQKALEEKESKLKKAEDYGHKITAMEAERCDQLEAAHKKLKAYQALGDALAALMPNSQVFVDETALKNMVQQEIAKNLPVSNIPEGNGAPAVSVTETVPVLEHKISRPIVQTDESTREGQLITLACHGFFDEKRRMADVGKEMNRVYLFNTGHLGRDLPPILGRLIELKVLQREEAASRGWLYWLADGAKDRIKEAS